MCLVAGPIYHTLFDYKLAQTTILSEHIYVTNKLNNILVVVAVQRAKFAVILSARQVYCICVCVCRAKMLRITLFLDEWRNTTLRSARWLYSTSSRVVFVYMLCLCVCVCQVCASVVARYGNLRGQTMWRRQQHTTHN